MHTRRRLPLHACAWAAAALLAAAVCARGDDALTLVDTVGRQDWLREPSTAPVVLVGGDAGPRMTLLRWTDAPNQKGGPPGFDEPMETDRPDFTSARTTVGRGVVQIEMGYTYLFDRAGVERSRSHSFPETMLRVGLFAEWLEFRVAYDVAPTTIWAGPQVSAYSPTVLYAAVSLQLTPQAGLAPEMVLMAQGNVFTKMPFDEGDEFLPGVDWVYGWDITDWLSLTGSLQANSLIDPVTFGKYLQVAWSWSAEYALLTDKLNAYTEFYGLSPSGADTVAPEYYFDAGLLWLITFNLQLDVRYGVGLNDPADDYFAGGGVSVRF